MMNVEQNFNEQVSNTSNIPSFLAFSNELILHIISFLGPAELLTIGQTCKLLKFIADGNEFWHPLFTKHKKKPCLITSRTPLLRETLSLGAFDNVNDFAFDEDNMNDIDFSHDDYDDDDSYNDVDNDIYYNDDSYSDADNNYDEDDYDSDFFQLQQQLKKPHFSQHTPLDVKSIVDASQNYYNWKLIFLRSIEYETLENAVNDAIDGDVIILPKGCYIVDHYWSINKSIDIIGDDFSETNTKYFAFVEKETSVNKNSISFILIFSFFLHFLSNERNSKMLQQHTDITRSHYMNQEKGTQSTKSDSTRNNQSESNVDRKVEAISSESERQKQNEIQEKDKRKVIIVSNKYTTLRWEAPHGRLQVSSNKTLSNLHREQCFLDGCKFRLQNLTIRQEVNENEYRLFALNVESGSVIVDHCEISSTSLSAVNVKYIQIYVSINFSKLSF